MINDLQVDKPEGDFVVPFSLMTRVRRSASVAALAAALAKAQGEIEGAEKGKVNPHFKSKYADLASVWEACRAPLSKNGLAVLQSTAADGATVTVTTILMHSSGEWMEGDLSMTAQQNTPQGIGSCITYARRYALAAMVGVAPEDDDGNAASQRSAPALVVQANPERPAAPEGCVYIERIYPIQKTDSGRPFTDVNFSDGSSAMAGGQQLIALLEQIAQEQCPLRYTVKKGNKGFKWIEKAERWREEQPETEPEPITEPLKAEEIPF